MIKTLAIALAVVLAALVVIPLLVMAGLVVWMKLTEETDGETLELEADI